jgi:type I restriction enzyme S subunit
MKSTHFTSENNKFYAGNHTIVMKTKTNGLNIKYLYYYLKLSNLMAYNRCSALIPELDKSRFYEMSLPLPPVETQEEIVAALDRIYDSVKSSKETIECLKSVMKSLIGTISRHTDITKKICDVCGFMNGKTLSGKNKDDGGEYHVMGGGMDYIGSYSKFNREGYNITISKSGASAGFVKWHDSKFWAGDCFTIAPTGSNLEIKYLYYYLKINSKTHTMSKTSGSTIPHCKWDDIANLHIHIPPIEMQQQIIIRLDALQSQISAFEETIKNSEDNAQFVLNSYVSL